MLVRGVRRVVVELPFSGWKRERKIALIMALRADYLSISAATVRDYIACE